MPVHVQKESKGQKDALIDFSNPQTANHSIRKKLKLCPNARDLNMVLKREPYYSRSVNGMIFNFPGATVFTIIW